MPPAAKRNSCVVLYDLHTGPEFATAAKKCLLEICASKWFMDSKDTLKLLLFNAKESRNNLGPNDSQMANLIDASDFMRYDPQQIAPLITNCPAAKGDWVKAVGLGIATAVQEILPQKGVITLQILLISDFSVDKSAQKQHVDFLISALNNRNIYLYILGPEVKYVANMSVYESVPKVFRFVEYKYPSEEKKNRSLMIAKRLAREVQHAVMCDLDIGPQMFQCYYNRCSLQPWNVSLTIGSLVTFNTSTIRFLRKAPKPKLKKELLPGLNQPWKWHLSEDILQEVAYEDVIGGVFKYNKFVPLPADVEKNFKYNGPRCFKILGFTSRENVPEYYHRGDGASYVQSSGSIGFNILVRVLAKQNKVAIARRVYMANCRPKLVVLIPNAADEVFIMVEIPDGDCIRAPVKSLDLGYPLNIDKYNPAVASMYEYLEKLNIYSPNNADENGSVKMPLGAYLMEPCRNKLMAQRLLQKYLRREGDFADYKLKLPQLVEDCSMYKTHFPKRPVIPTKKSSDK